MTLTHHDGLFILDSTFEERGAPKQAGFWWHGGGCRPGCAACAAGIGKMWWTSRPAAAALLREVADESAVAALSGHVAAVEASRAEDADVTLPVPDGLAYMPFQRAGIAYAMRRRGVLFADEMGLGKTIQAIGVVNADPDIKSVLVVCPASLRLNWKRELERWLTRPMRIEAIEGRELPSRFADVVIVNYDKLGGKAGAALRERLMSREFDVIVVDEAHLVKNPKAERTIAILGKRGAAGEDGKPGIASAAKRVLLLTGTPLLNRPIELYGLLSAVAPQEFGEFWAFARRYCNAHKGRFGWDLSGASHLDELQERMRGACMVRRLKRDVLKELPAKQRQVVAVPPNGAGGAVDAENEAWARHEETLERLEADVDVAHAGGSDAAYESAVARLRDAAQAAFAEMGRLRHATAMAKVPFVVEHVGNALEGTEKAIVFAWHHDVVAGIVEGLREYRPVVLTGETPMHERQAIVDKFQADPACRVFIGSIGAAGVGLTLTAASTVVFAELDWVPAAVTQAEDRAHRIGQESSVLVQHVVLDGSIDARMAKVIVQKQKVADAALDDRTRPVIDLKIPAIPSRGARGDVVARPPKYPVSNDAERRLAAEAIQRIAGMCDGAQALDGMGFNKIDAHVGKSLAERSLQRALTDGEVWLAKRLARTYRRQLPPAIVTELGVGRKENET